MDMLNNFVKGSAIHIAPSFNSLPGISSGPHALLGSVRQRSLYTSCSVMSMSSRGALIFLVERRVHSLSRF